MTDANLLLGRLDASADLAGGLRLRPSLATAAVERIATALGIGVPDAARGMLAVVEEVMAGAIRAVTIEQGADPRDATLVAFGGAGGLHATALARRLGMAGVIVPAHAGVFSALGLLLSPPRADAARSVILDAASAGDLHPAVESVAEIAASRLRSASGADPKSTECAVDVRYLGQAHEVTVPYGPGDGWDALAARFHSLHAVRNGFSRPDDPIEAVTVRAAAVGRAALRWSDLPALSPRGEVDRGRRAVITPDGAVDAVVRWRPALAPGDDVAGPAIVEEPEATTFIGRGEHAVLNDDGALVVEW